MISQKIKITPKIFNPCYWHLLKYLNDPNIRYIFDYGGSSASKTHSIMQALSIESYKQKYNVLAMRKQTNNLKDTIYTDFKKFNSKLQKKIPDINIIQNEIRSKRHYIRFKGVDDSEKLKGISAFTKLFLDEITEFNLEDFKQAKKRLRGRPNQQIIATWNPVSKDHWIKKDVLDKESWYDLSKKVKGIKYSQLDENSFVKINKTGNSILIKTTYKDNYWVVGHPDDPEIGFYDDHTIAEFEHDKIHNPNDYKIYALGEWGTPSEGLIFEKIKSFENLKERKNKIYWTTYEKLPKDIPFYKIYGLDFGGSGQSASDKPDGTSKNVLLELNINKDLRRIYVKLKSYKGYIDTNDLSNYLKQLEKENNKKCMILADNAQGSKITKLQMLKHIVVGAKTKEGKSFEVKVGYDFLREYELYIHVDDTDIHIEFENHKWEQHPVTKEYTGNVEDKFKDVADALRYAHTYYHLTYVMS
jgi:PBSX family phage terminase large subunit